MKVLVLCGGFPQLYLIKELKQRGIFSVLADQNPGAPAVAYADRFYPVSTLDVEGIRGIAETEKVDSIISVCADQMLLISAQISEELGLPSYIDYDTAKNVSSKEHMKRIFVENDIPTAKYAICSELSGDAISELQWPLIVKPVDCYSSKGVVKVTNEAELIRAFRDAVNLSRTNTAIIEEFVDGDELSVDIYVEQGVVKILCIRILDKIPGNTGFIICRGRYPAPVSDSIQIRIQNVAQQIANAFGLVNTPMLIQMKIYGERISVIEFSARTGGGIKYRLIPKVSGFDVVSAVVDLTLGKTTHCEPKSLDSYIIDEFLYCDPGELDHFDGFEQLLNEGIIDHYELYKHKGYIFDRIQSSGSRAAYFSVEAKTLDELEYKQRTAGNKVKAISSDGKDLIRHDIIQYIPY